MKRNNESSLTWSVEETAQKLGISRHSAYEAVRRGDIPTIRMGRRVLVPKAAIERLLAAAIESTANAAT